MTGRVSRRRPAASPRQPGSSSEVASRRSPAPGTASVEPPARGGERGHLPRLSTHPAPGALVEHRHPARIGEARDPGADLPLPDHIDAGGQEPARQRSRVAVEAVGAVALAVDPLQGARRREADRRRHDAGVQEVEEGVIDVAEGREVVPDARREPERGFQGVELRHRRQRIVRPDVRDAVDREHRGIERLPLPRHTPGSAGSVHLLPDLGQELGGREEQRRLAARQVRPRPGSEVEQERQPEARQPYPPPAPGQHGRSGQQDPERDSPRVGVGQQAQGRGDGETEEGRGPAAPPVPPIQQAVEPEAAGDRETQAADRQEARPGERAQRRHGVDDVRQRQELRREQQAQDAEEQEGPQAPRPSKPGERDHSPRERHQAGVAAVGVRPVERAAELVLVRPAEDPRAERRQHDAGRSRAGTR